MSDGFTITKEHRKIVYRTSRKLIWSGVIALAICAVFFGVNPFAFWSTSVGVLLVLATWIAAYHIMEAIKRHGASAS